MGKNKLFNEFPAIIHGEARGENDEFVIHTRYPRFLARRSFDETFNGKLPATPISGTIGKIGKIGKTLAYDSKIGIWLSDFVFLDSKPENQDEFIQDLTKACDRITADTVMLDEETPSEIL